MGLAVQKVPISLKDEYAGYLNVLGEIPTDALILALYAKGVTLEDIEGMYYQLGEVNG